MNARLLAALCAMVLVVVAQSGNAEVAPDEACNDFRAALHAYENGDVEHDALLDASEAVNRAIKGRRGRLYAGPNLEPAARPGASRLWRSERGLTRLARRCRRGSRKILLDSIGEASN